MVSDGQHFSQGVLPLPAGDEQAEGNFWVVEQLPVQGEHVEVDEGGEVVHTLVEMISQARQVWETSPFSLSKLHDLNESEAQ